MAPGVLRAEGVERVARPLSRSFPQQWGPAGSFPAFSPGCLGDRGTVTTSAGFSRWIPSVPGPASLAEGRRLASADAACGPAPRPGSRQDRFPAARVEAGRCVASFSHAPRRERLPAAAGCCARLVPRKRRVSCPSPAGYERMPLRRAQAGSPLLLSPHKTLGQNKIHLRATTFWGNVSTVNGNLDVAWMGRREYAGPLRGALGDEDLELGV